MGNISAVVTVLVDVGRGRDVQATYGYHVTGDV